MADANLFVGGTPVEQYPNCDGSRQFKEPHAHRIAYEYANGYFTPGWPLNPSEHRYQYVELMQANPVVGDHIMLYVIPEMHILTSILARVTEGDATMVGAALKPTALLYNSATRTYTEDPVLDTLFGTIAITAESDTFAALPTPYYVPKGKTLVLSLTVAALPSDATVKLHNTVAVVSLVAKAQGFDIPSEV
jgi:hypothetical protein